MSEVLIDSYFEAVSTSDRSITAQWPGGSGALAFGESFRPTLPYVLTSCKFPLRKAGAPTGNVRAYIYAHSGTFGNGTIIGDPLDTSDALDISTLTATSTLKTFTFSGGIALDPNSVYVPVLYSTDGVLDASNYVIMGGIDPGTHEGEGFRYLSTVGRWQGYYTIKVMFYVYGLLSLLPLRRIRS